MVWGEVQWDGVGWARFVGEWVGGYPTSKHPTSIHIGELHFGMLEFGNLGFKGCLDLANWLVFNLGVRKPGSWKLGI